MIDPLRELILRAAIAISFGIWQHSYKAAIFAAFILLLLPAYD